MAPQQPTPSPSSANGGQVVTVTLFSTASSGPSILPAPSGGSGAGVPIGAIAGGVAGGVTLAVIMVLVWKYWGLVIKRTEKRRRKEAVRFTFRPKPPATTPSFFFLLPVSSVSSLPFTLFVCFEKRSHGWLMNPRAARHTHHAGEY
jgi:hypothetical protein